MDQKCLRFVAFTPLGAGFLTGKVDTCTTLNVELAHDNLREIEAATAEIQVQGARLPESVLKHTGR